MGVKQRIQSLRGTATQGEFAKRLGISQSLVSAIEKGERRASLDVLQALHDTLGISIDWLISGQGEPYPITDGNVRESIGGRIPIVGTASANPHATILWERIEYEYTDLAGVVAVRIEDDSMEPIARAGQYALAIPGAELHDGDLAVISVKRKGVFFKRIFYNRKAHIFELQSANALRPQASMTVAPGDIVEQYRVIGVKFE